MSSSIIDKKRRSLGKRKKTGHEDNDTSVACYFTSQKFVSQKIS